MDNLPVMVMKDHRSRMRWSWIVIRKGREAWIIDTMTDTLKRLGHAKFIFKSDQEPAILALKELSLIHTDAADE